MNISEKYKKTAILTEKRRKNRTTTNIVENGRTRDEKYEASYRGNWWRRKLRWGRNIPRNPPVPQIGRDKNVISGRLRERRLGPQRLFYVKGLYVTFDQNGQNAISADFEFLAASLPDG